MLPPALVTSGKFNVPVVVDSTGDASLLQATTINGAAARTQTERDTLEITDRIMKTTS